MGGFLSCLTFGVHIIPLQADSTNPPFSPAGKVKISLTEQSVRLILSHKTVFSFRPEGRYDSVNLLDSRAGKIHSRVLCFQRPVSRGTKAVGAGRPASPHGKRDSLSIGVGFN